MPWRLRKAPKRDLYWVVGQDGKHMSKDPIPKERAQAQMRALYASERQQDEKVGKGNGTASPLHRDLMRKRKVEHHQQTLKQMYNNPAATPAIKAEIKEMYAESDKALEAIEREMGYKFFEGTTGKSGKGMSKLEKALHQRNVKQKDAEGRVNLYNTMNALYHLTPADKQQLKKEARDDRKAAEKLADTVQRMKETGYGRKCGGAKKSGDAKKELEKALGDIDDELAAIMGEMGIDDEDDGMMSSSNARPSGRETNVEKMLASERPPSPPKGAFKPVAKKAQAAPPPPPPPPKKGKKRSAATHDLSTIKEEDELEGEGIISDAIRKAREVATKVVDRVKKVATEGVRKTLPPSARKTLATYGDKQITALQVRRDPIQSLINQALNFITLGKWNQAKRDLHYDNLFHLGLVATVGGRPIVLEKNEVINISTAQKITSDTEFMDVPLNKQITLNEMVTKTEQYMGSNFASYDAFANNCQDFIVAILKANGIATPAVLKFVKQSTEQLIKKLPPYTPALARKITDLGAAANYVLEGDGKMKGGMTEEQKAFRAKRDAEQARLKAAQQKLYKENPAILQAAIDRDKRLRSPEYKAEQAEKRAKEGAVKKAEVEGFQARQKQVADYNAEMRRRRDSPLGKVVEGLTKAADFGVKYIAPVVGVPGFVTKAYKTFAPPGSEFYQGGAATVTMKKSDYIKEHKKLIALLSKAGKEGKEQAAELKKMTGGMMKFGLPGLTIDTTTEAPHPTTLSAAKIQELQAKINFDEDATREAKWKVISEVLDYLLSDKKYLQNSSDDMDIAAAKANMPKNPANGNPNTWANVIGNVLGRLEPVASGAGRLVGAGKFKDEIMRLAAKYSHIPGVRERAARMIEQIGALNRAGNQKAAAAALVGIAGLAGAPFTAGATAVLGSYAALGLAYAANSTSAKQAVVDIFESALKKADSLLTQKSHSRVRDVLPGRSSNSNTVEMTGVDNTLEFGYQNPMFGQPRRAASSSNAASSSSNTAAPPRPVDDIPSRRPPKTPAKQFAPTKPTGRGRITAKLLHIGPSSQAGKKFTVVVQMGDKKKTIHFGAKGMDDFTLTKDKSARKRYLERHQAREDWTKSGVGTAGFWSRWVLWEKPTIQAAVAAVKKRFRL